MKIFAFLFALFASSSFAAAVPLSPGPGIAGTAGGFTTAANFTGQFSAASFNNTFTTNVGGKMVTMPATMRLAANAGQFAVNAVRLSPGALLGTAVASWLLGYGLQYLNGQWQKSAPDTGPIPGKAWAHGLGGSVCTNTNQGCSFEQARAAAIAQMKVLYPTGKSFAWTGSQTVSPQVVYLGIQWLNASNQPQGANVDFIPGGTPQPQYQPATEQDFAVPGAASLPDSVANELAPKAVPLPLEVPHIAPQDVPIGEPYIDPVTGKRYQDKARLTPSSDAKTADVQVTNSTLSDSISI